MSVDFQQLRNQITALGDRAPAKAREIKKLREQTLEKLENFSTQRDFLIQRVDRVVNTFDPNLRCALPVNDVMGREEPLDGCFSLPDLPDRGTILAVDGSQITPDRHAEVNYCLINLGAIRLNHASAEAPVTFVETKLYYGEDLFTEYGQLSEARLALQRDFFEREYIARLALSCEGPVVSFTDGPMELWGSRDPAESSAYKQTLDDYYSVLVNLRHQGIITAGYVDKPGANLVVRLLEVASMPDNELTNVRRTFPMRGVTDFWLYQYLLQPGERSAVFAIQSKSARSYPGETALNFFYLNVGYDEAPWIARVEVPAWVVENNRDLDLLHAILIDQCRVLGGRSYPYLLHRAHETAVVTQPEKAQVTQMIVQELIRRGVTTDRISYKQSTKDLAGRARYRI